MKFKYIWYDEPETVKTYDTAKGYRDHRIFSKLLQCEPMTPEAWDKWELEKIEEKKRAGLVISYTVTE